MNRTPRVSCDHLDVRVHHESGQWTAYESPDPAALFVGITSDPKNAAGRTRIAFRAESREEVDRVAELARTSDGNRYEICYRAGAT